MEQRNEKFDKDVKSILDSHQVPVPEQVWDKIITQKEDKKGAAYFNRYRWLLVLLLLIPVYAGYELLWEQDKRGGEMKMSSEQSLLEQPDNNVKNNNGEGINKSTNSNEFDKITPANNQMEPAAPTSKSLSSENTSQYNNSQSGNLFSVTIASNQNTNENNVAEEHQNSSGSEDETENPVSAGNNTIAMQTAGETVVDDSLNGNVKNNEAGILADSTSANKTDSVPGEPKSEKEKPAEKEKFVPEYSIEMVASPDVSFKDLQNNPQNTVGGYKKRREESEQHDYAYSFNLFFRYDFAKNFFVRSGIQYARIYENLSVQIKERYIAGFAVDTLLKGFILDPFQPPVPYFLIDTIYDYRYNEYQFASDNRYTYVNIPVLVGANFSFKKFDLYATAGVTINIASASVGKIIAPDSIYLIVINDMEKSPFKNKTGVSFMTSLGVSYHLSEKIHFLFEPNFRTNLNSITHKEYSLKQKYSAVGFGLGIKYDF